MSANAAKSTSATLATPTNVPAVPSAAAIETVACRSPVASSASRNAMPCRVFSAAKTACPSASGSLQYPDSDTLFCVTASKTFARTFPFFVLDSETVPRV